MSAQASDSNLIAFNGKISDVLTINATSENQANRYMSQENPSTSLRVKDLGLGNQDSCPWRECQTKKATELLRLFPMNWEAQTSAAGKSK